MGGVKATTDRLPMNIEDIALEILLARNRR